jgi:hypothetical protein
MRLFLKKLDMNKVQTLALSLFCFLIVVVGVFYVSSSKEEAVIMPLQEIGEIAETGVPPIYVTIVTHNEEPRSGAYPDFVNDEEAFWEHREATVVFAELMHEYSIGYQYQSDWNFLLAATMYDVGTEQTDGKNFLRYLSEDLGVYIDPHAHEKEYSYADVAYLIESLGVESSNTVGGLIASPAEDSKLEYLQTPVQGWIYPDQVWVPEILWGGSTSLHKDEESLWISGVWKPQDNAHFTTHDAEADLVYVGGNKIDWVGLDQLLEAQAKGELDPELMYTQSIMVVQLEYLEKGFIKEVAKKLAFYQDQTNEGLIEWKGFEEIVEIWKKKYEEVPSMRWFASGL